MKKIISISTMILLVMALVAPQVLATNGMNFIGIGAYQKGMGGAVTAAPHTTATAITNPAGMAFIGTRTDFSVTMFTPERYVDFVPENNADEYDTTGGSELYMAPAIGFNAKAWYNDDVWFGGGMYGIGGMGVDYDEVTAPQVEGMMQRKFVDYDAKFGGGSVDGKIIIPDYTTTTDTTDKITATYDPQLADGNSFSNSKANIWSNYQFWKMAPSAAWKINNKLAVGGAFNFDYQAMGMESYYTGDFIDDINKMTGAFGFKDDFQHFGLDLSETQSAFGAGFTLGTMYQYSDNVTLGASYTSEQYFTDYEYRLDEGDILYNIGDQMYYNKKGTYKMQMNAPQQLSLGMAYRPNSKWLITTDVKWINYSSTMDTIDLEADDGGEFVNAMNPDPKLNKDTMPLKWGWDDIYVYALGVQYNYSPKLTLRGGLNYGESPIEGEDVFANLPAIAVVEKHASLGFTYELDEHWEFSGAYMHVFENEVDATKNGSPIGITSGLEEDSYEGTLSYKF
ncbi:OmpP1/FadL family transporter [Selenihalanaerobacter shriftii]|uniref:Long-chain fatty acid transport protein n=1 Tax=Selenihalanaerobacter shriftii TaxID=142842 RepID=A0A1T4M6W0_9FIRM|nr:outer membrane protein transport protein [Selenihalanaerobacter shriftii]SJZ62641.1 long-chain fatty acid transport protein [Selenihalanaerobacter shriftii]